MFCAGIRPKTLMVQSIIIILSWSRNHQNHFAFWLGYLQPMANYWCKPISTYIPLDKSPICLGRRSKQGKVICPGSQHFSRSGGRTRNLPFMGPVPLDHMCPQACLSCFSFSKISPISHHSGNYTAHIGDLKQKNWWFGWLTSLENWWVEWMAGLTHMFFLWKMN